MVEAPAGTEKFIQTKTGNIRIPTFNLLQTPSFKSIKEMYNKYLIVDNIPCIMCFPTYLKLSSISHKVPKSCVKRKLFLQD